MGLFMKSFIRSSSVSRTLVSNLNSSITILSWTNQPLQLIVTFQISFTKILWAHAEFTAECPVEVRHIAEAAIVGNIQHLLAFRRETRCCIAQPCSAHILMRRNSRQALERAQKMV